MPSGDHSLEDFLLEERKKHSHATGELNGLIFSIARGCKIIAKNINGRIDLSNLLKKYASFAVLAVRPIAIVKKEKKKNVSTIFPSPGLMLIIFLINPI